MDESKLSMSNEANECFCMSGMLVNQLITSDVFFHWLSFVISLTFELILSRICLLTFPSSFFAGFMRRHVGWLAKLSLWSFRLLKGCCFAICSVRLSMLSSWVIDFACESMMLAVSVLAFLFGVCSAASCQACKSSNLLQAWKDAAISSSSSYCSSSSSRSSSSINMVIIFFFWGETHFFLFLSRSCSRLLGNSWTK